MLAFVDLEDPVPRDHPLRVAKRLVRFSLRQVAREAAYHASTPGSAVVVVAERDARTVPPGKATSQAVVAAEAQR